MRLRTILKDLDRIIDLYTQGKKGQAIKLLIQLRNRIELKLKEEEEKQKEKNPTAHKLAKWYYGLWEGKIPEGNFARAVNVLKSLLEEFKLSEEEIKDSYLWWLNLKKEGVPKELQKTYSIVLTEKETRSITDFKGKLRYVMALRREMERSKGFHMSPEAKRGVDYYIKQLEEKKEELFDEGDELSW